MAESIKRTEQLAAEIIKLSRSLLMVNFMYLDRTIAHLPAVLMEKVSIATDGAALYYDCDFVLWRFRQEKSGVTRDILHAMLHCVFQHMFVGPKIDRTCWDIACDIAVEHMITELKSEQLASDRADLQKLTIALLKDELPMLTAEHIYRWLREHDFSKEELSSLRDAFQADNHSIWYGEKHLEAKAPGNVDLKKTWADVSRRMKTEMEIMHHDNSSALAQNLRRLNRKKQDYSEFLMHFGTWGEVMQLSPDEFDQNFYTYGLELYGNVPLIEPLEYTEQRRIRDLVIVIDTSGSVKGELVQSFVQKTYYILQQKASFHTQFRLLILQCDDRVREAVWIRSQEDLEEYIGHMEILGLGQTDFRPAFSYVDELLRKKELGNLQGLLYFTDGEGTFPEKAPPYETAFILPTEDMDESRLPRWALGIVFTEEDLPHGRA